jgi:hypothetical protein
MVPDLSSARYTSLSLFFFFGAPRRGCGCPEEGLVEGALPCQGHVWRWACTALGGRVLEVAGGQLQLRMRGTRSRSARWSLGGLVCRCVVGEERHESDRPQRIGRTERAPSADVLGRVSAWFDSSKKKTSREIGGASASCTEAADLETVQPPAEAGDLARCWRALRTRSKGKLIPSFGHSVKRGFFTVARAAGVVSTNILTPSLFAT